MSAGRPAVVADSADAAAVGDVAPRVVPPMVGVVAAAWVAGNVAVAAMLGTAAAAVVVVVWCVPVVPRAIAVAAAATPTIPTEPKSAPRAGEMDFVNARLWSRPGVTGLALACRAAPDLPPVRGATAPCFAAPSASCGPLSDVVPSRIGFPSDRFRRTDLP